ncbi:hypothetical protein ACROYT_G009865 [Oculina patagonica]
MKSACLPPELLEEALYVLAAENEKSMNDANGMQGFFKGGNTAGNLFKTALLLSIQNAITPSKGQRFLNSIGHCYTLGSIVKSELRILQTLDYHILITTPLTFLETILEILGHNDSRAQVKLLHDASVKVLDIVYLKFEKIYTKLCMAATGENCIKDGRQNLSVLTNDLMLLAVSVIGAASYIVNQATSDMVVEQLGLITQIPVDDVLDFATIIIENTL